MFDATKGQAAVTEQIEVSSDEFAARFSELQPRDQLAFLRRANELLESPEQVSAFQAGAFAQGAGQPALQLGGGGASAPTPAEIANAIKAYVAHTGAPREQENLALRSLLPDGDPAFIKATHGGEPAATVNLQNELKNTKDPKSIGSLAFELAQEKKEAAAEKKRLTDELTAERNKPGPSGWVKAEGLDDLIDQVIEQVQNIGRGGGHAYAKSEALKKLDQLKGKVTV